jgi:predicted dienelactone hydrolase
MFKHVLRDLLCAAVVLVLGPTAAAVAATPVDAPELALPGPHPVGLRRLAVDVGAVPDIDALASGNATAAPLPRRIEALLWYPAALNAATTAAPPLERVLRNHAWRGWPEATVRMSLPSTARPDAPVADSATSTTRLPVVVFSHGMLNWAELMSDLAEHLASRGYVVLALQHEDERHADPLRAALALRAVDQAAALRTLAALDTDAADALHRRLLHERVAIVGYSMGGYGALISAGARVADDGMAYRYAPAAAMQRHAAPLDAAGTALAARVAAVVAFAPWGAQPAIGAFKPAGLSGVKVPTLLVAGDADDISGYADGTRAIWESLVAAPRALLTFENARHNIVQNALPAGLPAGFRTWENLEEPVWRRERLLAINRHFVTAFLDSRVRGEAASNSWLRLATVRAVDGAWPVPMGTPATGSFAGPAQGNTTHWTGFQRRWALGLRLEWREAAAAR